MRDAEPEAGAAVAIGHAGLEEGVADPVGDAGPVVGHGEQDPLGTVHRVQGDPRGGVTGRVVDQGLDRPGDQSARRGDPGGRATGVVLEIDALRQ